MISWQEDRATEWDPVKNKTNKQTIISKMYYVSLCSWQRLAQTFTTYANVENKCLWCAQCSAKTRHLYHPIFPHRFRDFTEDETRDRGGDCEDNWSYLLDMSGPYKSQQLWFAKWDLVSQHSVYRGKSSWAPSLVKNYSRLMPVGEGKVSFL